MNINYDGKKFRSISNTDNGEVDGETYFNYHQEDGVVWAEYSGGNIIKGSLIAKVDKDGNLDMRYQHINRTGELMTGKCFSKPQLLEGGRIRLIENWEWTSGDFSRGESIIEEIDN